MSEAIKQVAENTKDIYARKVNILIKKIQDLTLIVKDFKIDNYKEEFDKLSSEMSNLKEEYIKSQKELEALKKETRDLKREVERKTKTLEEFMASNSKLAETIMQKENKLKKEIIENIDEYVENKLLKLLSA